MSGVKSITTSVFNFLIAPYKKAWAFIKEAYTTNGKSVINLIFGMAKSVWGTISGFFSKIPSMILDGLKSVGSGIYNALKEPFSKAWQWLKDFFLGNSPSQLGLMIVDGIMAVEGMLMKALISPFQKAWDFIKALPFVSKLFGGVDVAKNVKPEDKTQMTVERPKLDIDTNKKTNAMADVVGNANDELVKIMSSVLGAVNGLRDDLKAGAINANVHLDGQRLDSQLGRSLKYRGSLT